MALRTSQSLRKSKASGLLAEQPKPKINYLSNEQYTSAKSVGCILGSFDPPHRGHDQMIREMFSRYEIVLLLLPNVHFEKEVQFPKNMTHVQRIEILAKVYEKEFPNRVGIGIAYEVTFIKLWDQLRELFPNAKVYFGMGNDVFECFLSSKEYFAEIGRNWTEKEQIKLAEVGEHCVVFGRENPGNVLVREVVSEKNPEGKDATIKVLNKSGNWSSLRDSDKKFSNSEEPPVGIAVGDNEDVTVVRQISTAGNVSVPPEFHVSSTHVRLRVTEIRNSTSQENLKASLLAELDKYLLSPVIDFIIENNLYTE